MKRQISEWEKIIGNKTSDKGLISKVYKQFIQFNIRGKKKKKKKPQQQQQPNQKIGRRPEQKLLQRRQRDGQ